MTNKFVRNARGTALVLSLTSGLASIAVPSPAAAFCGFYVTGADANLYSNATMVVMMRDGTRTVLSIQNNYQGPPEAFALVVPVPTVLQKEHVNVLPNEVFGRVDKLGAPRLVEYWETDPCWRAVLTPATASSATVSGASPSAAAGSNAAKTQVRIEAQFAVGEYDVVVLSADDSSALDTWLRDNKYNIPAGAEPVLAPYVASGMKFFVAKVDPMRVTFNGNQAALSPLRFHYDTPEFSLPVRLGLLNSQGSQDLIVNILAAERYELANYNNASIPTNIRVRNDVRDDFGAFYEALFARTIEQSQNAVVTEYSWSASSCDPCPTPPLSPQDIATLGGDVLQDVARQNQGQGGAPAAPTVTVSPYSFTLTRLHARYTKDSLGEDLVFKRADGIMGGRGVPDQRGQLEQAVQPAGGFNNFQGRYVILHPWEKTLTCSDPIRGRWGGPPGGGATPQAQAPANGALTGAAPKAGELPKLLAESLPALSVTAESPSDPLPGLPIASGAKPAMSIQTMPATNTTTPPRAGVATTKPGATAGAAASTPQTTTGAAAPRPSNEGGLCSAAPGRSSGMFALLAWLAGLAVFGVRRRQRQDGVLGARRQQQRSVEESHA